MTDTVTPGRPARPGQRPLHADRRASGPRPGARTGTGTPAVTDTGTPRHRPARPATPADADRRRPRPPVRPGRRVGCARRPAHGPRPGTQEPAVTDTATARHVAGGPAPEGRS
ncbi:hypothetical protein SUDANB150_03814 [Streptomyces sp. enrichment culture]